VFDIIADTATQLFLSASSGVLLKYEECTRAIIAAYHGLLHILVRV
jgi:hypothetical protein